MAKELPFFRFFSSEWLNGDISMENKGVKGVFVDVCAYYWFKDCELTLKQLNKKFSLYPKEIDRLLEDGYIKIGESDNIHISFLDEQYVALSGLRKKKQEAGRKGGNARKNDLSSA